MGRREKGNGKWESAPGPGRVSLFPFPISLVSWTSPSPGVPMGQMIFGLVLIAAAFFMMVARAGLSGSGPRPAGTLLRTLSLVVATIGGVVILSAFIVVVEP